MVGVAHIGRLVGEADRAVFQQLVVAGGVAIPSVDPAIKMRQLGAKNGRLDCVNALTQADLVMLVFGGSAVVTELPDLRQQLGISAGDRAGIAECSQVLPRIKAETGEVAHAAAALAIVFRSVRLARVLDQVYAVAIGDGL